MTADSELFVTETVCHVLEQKIWKLIPRGSFVDLRVPSGWWGHWDASGFPDRGEAEVFLNGKGHQEKFGTVSWETKFTVADYGGPVKCIEAWPVNLKFKKAISSRQTYTRSRSVPDALPSVPGSNVSAINSCAH